MKLKIYLLSILCVFSSIAYSENKKNKQYDPWYTGPLITSGANNLKPNRGSVQAYLFATDIHALYNSKKHHHTIKNTSSINPVLYLKHGLTNFLDTYISIQGFYTQQDSQHAIQYGDTSVNFGIQLLRDKKHTCTPSMRLTIEEFFPTGKYKNLKPSKINSSGSGSYITILSLNFSKLVYWIKNHPLSFRFSVNYDLITSLVHVTNFHSYGGGFDTNGKTRPPNIFLTAFSFEFSFTQRWVYAMDFTYSYSNATHFHGLNGTTTSGSPATNVLPSADQWTIAPALEYNFTDNYGIIAGAWLTTGGRNTNDFISYVISITHDF